MSYGNSLGLTLPTVSVTAGPTYAELINEALETIIDVLEAKVTPAGMTMSSDLSMKPSSTNFALIDVERVALQNKSATISQVTYPNSLFVAGGELYFNDGNGLQTRITVGGEVDASSLGGITGAGYGSTGVEVNWAVADLAYKMRSGSDSYADVWVDDVRFNDFATGFYVTLSTATTPTDSYDAKMPPQALLPALATSGNTRVMVMATDGAITLNQDPQFQTITAKGALAVVGACTLTTGGGATTMGGTLSVTGATTLVGAVTCNSTVAFASTIDVDGVTLTGSTTEITVETNRHIVLAGTGRLKTGSMYMRYPAMAFRVQSAERGGDTDWDLDATNTGTFIKGGAANTYRLYIPIVLPGGTRITGWSAYVDPNGATITGQLYNAKTGATVGSSDGSNSASATTISQTGLTADISDTADSSSGQAYYLRLTPTSGGTHEVFGATITYESL